MIRFLAIALICLGAHARSAAETITNQKFTTDSFYKLLLTTSAVELIFEKCEFTAGGTDWVPDVPIKVNLTFRESTFDVRNSFVLSGRFTGSFYFEQCLGRLRFSGFNGLIPTFRKCVLETLDMDQTHFRSPDPPASTVLIDDSKIEEVTISGTSFSTTKNLMLVREGVINKLDIEASVFSNVSRFARKEIKDAFHESEFLIFETSEINSLIIQECTFDVIPWFNKVYSADQLVFRSNDLKKPIYPLELFFTPDASQFRFADFAGKTFDFYNTSDTTYEVIRFTDVGDFGPKFNSYYRAYPYDRDPYLMIAFYKRLITVFDQTGDLRSYDECYKALKNVEKNASHFDYLRNTIAAKKTAGNKTTGNKTLESLFQWRMNQFLELFCDYGTNPVKSLVFSVYIILIFCIIYVLFPSEPDNLSFSKLFGAVQRYIDHFAEQGAAPVEDVEYNASLQSIDKFRANLETHGNKLPPAVAMFGKPIHIVARGLVVGKRRLNNVAEFNLYSDWHLLKTSGKIKTTTIITLSLFGFLAWGLIMRVLNAVALSLNAFVTLGYGEIEASGIARYFCVLEGLMGWFLLSIFSVSLIGQILQ